MLEKQREEHDRESNGSQIDPAHSDQGTRLCNLKDNQCIKGICTELEDLLWELL